MKKLGIFFALFVLGTLCFAQSNNDAQRIVGTWSGNYLSRNCTFTFNANGTYSASFYGSNFSGNYILSGSKLLLENFQGIQHDYFFSADSRQLVIIGGDEVKVWLRKQ